MMTAVELYGTMNGQFFRSLESFIQQF